MPLKIQTFAVAQPPKIIPLESPQIVLSSCRTERIEQIQDAGYVALRKDLVCQLYPSRVKTRAIFFCQQLRSSTFASFTGSVAISPVSLLVRVLKGPLFSGQHPGAHAQGDE